jgi:hypothetical protein
MESLHSVAGIPAGADIPGVACVATAGVSAISGVPNIDDFLAVCLLDFLPV